MKELITIITPTYNRLKEITELYDSLCNQSNKNFVWIVIDDGSEDNTHTFFDKIIKSSNIKIEYYYKKNGGKHTALNYAFKKIKTKLFCVVDSDDYLIKDAIQIIKNNYDKYKNDDIFGFVYLKGYSIDNPTTVKFRDDEFVGDYILDIINKQPHGDRFEVFYTDLIKNNEFPVYKNEKFIGEGYFWNKISRNKRLVFINKVLYICDYLTGGLTRQGRKMRIMNSMGGMTHANEYIKKDYSLKLRIKNMILLQAYYYFAKEQGKEPLIIKNSFLKIICFVPGFVLYLLWKKKYYN